LNCKNWAKSYRDKVPCTVCKDNRGHYSAYYKVTCSDCKGSGRNYAAEKKAKWDNSEEGKKYNKENSPVLAYSKRLEELSNQLATAVSELEDLEKKNIALEEKEQLAIALFNSENESILKVSIEDIGVDCVRPAMKDRIGVIFVSG
jgi:hypothetical protein